MATGIESLIVSVGIQAGSPFVLGDVIYVAQATPPQTVRSTPNIFVDTTKSPQQIQVGSTTTQSTIIGTGALESAPISPANQVILGTNATSADGQDSVVIGHGAGSGAVHPGNGGIAIGAAAAVGGAGSNAGGGVAVGDGAVANNGVAVGEGATCLTGQVAVGFGADAVTFGVAVGGSATASFGGGHGNGSIAIGRSASAGESTDIAIGTGNTGTASGGGGNVLLGSGVGGSGAQGHDSVIIGSSSNTGGSGFPASATASGIFATVIGGNSQAQHSGARLLGRGLVSTANNQTLIGGTDDPCATCVLGNGATNAAPQNVIVGVTGGTGLNAAGASHTLAGGIATGSGIGGSILFQTSVVAASSSTPQALATALTIDNTQTCIFANPPIIPTTAAGAPASKAGTLTNLPGAATAGDPQLYITIKTATHTYAVPAWQIA